MERELDLLEGLAIPVRRWRTVVGVFLSLLVLGAALAWALPPRYTALATLAQTADDRLVGDSRRERLNSIALFMGDASLQQAVIDELGELLPADLRNAQALRGRVGGGVLRTADSIRITMSHRDPAVASAVVNTYARLVAERGNRLFLEARAEDLSRQKEALQGAEAAFREAQVRLEDQLAESPADALRREMTMAEATLQAAADGQAAWAIGTAHSLLRVQELLLAAKGLLGVIPGGGQPADARSAQAAALLWLQAYTLVPEVVPISTTLSSPFGSGLTVPLLPTERLVLPALPGETPLAEPSDEDAPEASPTAAVMAPGDAEQPSALPASSVGLTVHIPSLVEPGLTSEALRQAVGALIVSLEGRRSALEGQMAAIAQTTDVPPEMAQQEAHLRQLKADWAREQAANDLAREQRDLAWQGYRTVAVEVARWEAALQVMPATGEMVRWAVAASPQLADGQPRVQIVALTGIVGLLLGCLLAWLQDLRARRRLAR